MTDNWRDELYHYGVQGMKWGVWNEDTKARKGFGGRTAPDLPNIVTKRKKVIKKDINRAFDRSMSKDAKKRSDSVNDFGRKLGKFVSAANTITAQAGKVNEDGFNELVTEEELEKFRKDQYWRVRLAMRTNNDLTRHEVMTDIEFNDIEKGKIYRDVVRDTGSGKKHAREFYRVNNDLYVKDYLGANGTNTGLSVTKKVCSNCFPPKSAVQRAAKTASMLATKNRVKPHKVN